jgi:hypothetical protein
MINFVMMSNVEVMDDKFNIVDIFTVRNYVQKGTLIYSPCNSYHIHVLFLLK